MMRRRHFLSVTTAAVGTLAVAPRTFGLPPDHRYFSNLGLQLYTVRNQLAEDPRMTIEAIAKAGYRQVELGSVVDGEPLVKLAKENGMEVTSAFFDWRCVATPDAEGVPEIDEVIDKASQMGLKHLVFGYIGKGHRETADHFRRISETANRVGEKISNAGMRMSYHNHSFEFQPLENDVMGYEILMDQLEPDCVGFELDVFWAAIGGWNPLEILRRLDKRTVQLHLKDIRPGTGTIFDESQVPVNAFQEVGDGSIMFRELIQLADQIGVEQCHVEQDQSPAPLDSIVQSYNYLRDLDL
jgi:sugar phosphate isomerase/epimerase